MTHPNDPEPYDDDRPVESSEPPARADYEESPVPPPPRPRPRTPRPRSEPSDKSPVLAAFLSLMPGLGNVYNGLYTRGIAFFFIWASLLGMAIETGHSGREENLGFIIPTIVFFFFFNIFDAYRQATLINLGMLEEDEPWAARRPGGNLMLGVALLVVGLYGILVKYFDIDMAWVLDNWPIAVTAFGGWLVFQAWRQNSDEENPADGY